MNNKNKTKDNAWIGIVLVVLGGYFILRNLGIIPYSVYNFLPYAFFSWKMLIVIIGGAMVVTGQKRGFIFIGIGAVLLIPSIFREIYWLQFGLRDLWPLILIAIGVSIFMKRRDSEKIKQMFSKEELSEDFIEELNVFGGSERFITSKNFRGGNVSSVFGGSVINLLDAELSPDHAVIDAFSLFGGCTFVVPRDWNIIMDGTNIFGGYTDKRFPNSYDTPIDPNKVLRIKGTAIFGGGEIKRV